MKIPSRHGTGWSDDPVAEAHITMLVSRLAACGSLQLSEPDRLELLQELGSGTFGSVYLCRSREDAELFVLKRVSLEKLNAKGVVQLVSEVSLRIQ